MKNSKLRYRLALDLGSTSLGWAMLRLNAADEPCAIIKAGSRIFSDGRNPKDGSSLAVTRREARAARRRRDRLLKRKARMMRTLIAHGFFPDDEWERKQLETLNPYALRAKGLDTALTPAEFGRALFHINQRRGFKSNRKTDKADNDSGALKTAINTLRQTIAAYPLGADGKPMKTEQFHLLAWVSRGLEETKNDKPRTVGELLHRRGAAGQTVRARYHQDKTTKDDGKSKIDKYYDLYIDRAMIETEFDALWATQSALNSSAFTETARLELKDCLLHQRPLKPVKPGRCTLMPDEERAPLALPSQQRFRIYQELSNLRILGEGLQEQALTLAQRNALVDALETGDKTFKTAIPTLLGLSGAVKFNLADEKRKELKGNATSARLSKKELFGEAWTGFSLAKQDAIVWQLVKEENEATLIRWLQVETNVDEARAEKIANVALPDGYGSLSLAALQRILPAFAAEVVTYDKAVLAAGFDHHSNISAAASGEILPALPYYGEYLQRHVGFGTGVVTDTPEKRYGKIANPTVHIGLNQTRLVVNALIKRYGHPSEVIVEVARELKQSLEQRKETQEQQAKNQKRNDILRGDAAKVLQISPDRVRRADIEKLILWEELSFDVADRRCPYSGKQISMAMVLSAQVEIEHILPFSETLDDTLNNKTVALREANRIKGNRTPFQAREVFEQAGWSYDDILSRAEHMPRNKRYRFGIDGYERWLREDKSFLARALNDTRHLSRVAREYMALICPQGTRLIPGQMTAMLRGRFGLNEVLSLDGLKNRNDHRHHAVDACVIGVTDQGMLQRFAQASASARERQLNRLVENMPLPWPSYREHVARAVGNIWVSHKPDHGYEAGFADDTAYRPPHLDPLGKWRTRGIGGNNPNERDANTALIAIVHPSSITRHHATAAGEILPYKGYVGGDNYSIEITRSNDGKWDGVVTTTFEAYKIVRDAGLMKLRHPTKGKNGLPLVMRLVAGDALSVVIDGKRKILRVVKMRAGRNQVTLVGINEANHANRMKEKDTTLVQLQDQSSSSLKRLQARRVTISPIGELRDGGFIE